MHTQENLGASEGIELIKAIPTSVANDNKAPASDFFVMQNYPNPFNLQQ